MADYKRIGFFAGLGVAVVGLAALVITDRDYPEYYFKGKVGNEHAKFYEDFWGNHVLEVIRPNHRYKMTCVDSDDDLEVDYVKLKNGNNVTEYQNGEDGFEDIVFEAQDQFDLYLGKVTEIQKKALKSPLR